MREVQNLIKTGPMKQMITDQLPEEAQDYVLRQLKPGVTLADIFRDLLIKETKVIFRSTRSNQGEFYHRELIQCNFVNKQDDPSDRVVFRSCRGL